MSHLIAEEFWAQGDLERARFGERPAPMMDREASLAAVQIDFIDGICAGVYGAVDDVSAGVLASMRKGVAENRRRWEEQTGGGEQREKEEEEDKGGEEEEVSEARDLSGGQQQARNL